MGILFRDRNNKTTFDSSYFLKNGDKMGDMSNFRIGDDVIVMFDVTTEQQDAINRSDQDVFVSNLKVHIPCVVVTRSQYLAWVSIGNLQDLGVSMCLEATSGMWEDILKWVIINAPPRWVAKP